MASEKSAEFWKQYQAAKRLVKHGEQESRARYAQFLASGIAGPDIVYDPVATSNPTNPRCRRMEYYKPQQTLLVEWGDGGTPYAYYGVTLSEMRRIMRYKSAGKAINNVLAGKPYGPVG